MNTMMGLDDLAKEIPGGATILWEEKSIQSDTYECNGEAMHEEWEDSETPVAAMLRLYDRIKKAKEKKAKSYFGWILGLAIGFSYVGIVYYFYREEAPMFLLVSVVVWNALDIWAIKRKMDKEK